MASTKVNPFSKANPDTGFGTQPSQIGGRFINKDGSFNLRREGWPLHRRISIYAQLLALSGTQFLMIILGFFLMVNICFTGLYLFAGPHQLNGLLAHTSWSRVKELFYFSVQ